MDLDEVMKNAFVDELEKIGASLKRLSVPKSRAGRRSISVANFLKKDNNGSLFKKHGFQLGYEDGPYDAGGAKPPKKKGEAPSRDNSAPSSREDGRENATNVQGPSTLLTDIGSL